MANAARARTAEDTPAPATLDTAQVQGDDAQAVALLVEHLGAVVVEDWSPRAGGVWHDQVSGRTTTTKP